MERQQKKKKGLVIGLVLCLALVGVAGVMAWYASQSSITNTFSTGNIKPPTTDPTDPQKPIDPTTPPEQGGHQGQTDGNIVENKWTPGSAITPGSAVPKNPNIGLGKGSDNAYVFVYVKNNLGEGTSFKLNPKWAPVTGAVTEVAGQSGYYKGGLFAYVGSTGTDPVMLQASKTEDVYTGEVFSEVIASADAQIEAKPTMDVSCYLMAKSGSEENLTAGDAKTQALAWANHPNGPATK